MTPIRKQYSAIKEEMDFNQQEYKIKQNKLLAELEQLQNKCPHDDTTLNESFSAQCNDCFKIITEKINKKNETIDDDACLTIEQIGVRL